MNRVLLTAVLSLLTALPNAARADGPAPRKLVLVGVGDCRDEDLRGALTQLATSLQSRLGADLLSEDTVRPHLNPVPEGSLKAVDQALEDGKALFYDGNYPRAIRELERGLAILHELPPGPGVFKLQAELLAFKANSLRHENHLVEAIAAFDEIVAVAPDYQLDPGQFAPSTRAFYREVRAQEKSRPRFEVSFESTPAGATVYLNGFELGRTPLTAKLPAGEYDVRLAKDGALSLAHVIALPRSTRLNVDLDFEGGITSQWPLCVQQHASGAHGAPSAHRLAALLGADDAVAAWLDRSGPGAAWLTSSLFKVSTAEAVREGRVRLGTGASAVSDLTGFLLTGSTAPRVQAVAHPTPLSTPPANFGPPGPSARAPVPNVAAARPTSTRSTPAATSGQAAPAIVPAFWPASPSPSEPPSPVGSSEPGVSTSPDPAPFLGLRHPAWELGLASGAAAALSVGVGTAVASQSKVNAVNTLLQGQQPTAAQAPTVKALWNQSQTLRGVAIVGFATGGALLAADVVWVLLDRPQSRASVTVSPWASATGAGAQVSLRWP
jgi:hypothetical protein